MEGRVQQRSTLTPSWQSRRAWLPVLFWKAKMPKTLDTVCWLVAPVPGVSCQWAYQRVWHTVCTIKTSYVLSSISCRYAVTTESNSDRNSKRNAHVDIVYTHSNQNMLLRLKWSYDSLCKEHKMYSPINVLSSPWQKLRAISNMQSMTWVCV